MSLKLNKQFLIKFSKSVNVLMTSNNPETDLFFVTDWLIHNHKLLLLCFKSSLNLQHNFKFI